jgi:hypothetical protein
VFQLAGFFGVMLGMNVLSYLFSVYIHIPVFANPLVLVAFCILYLINPIRIMQYKARMWFLRIMVSIPKLTCSGKLGINWRFLWELVAQRLARRTTFWHSVRRLGIGSRVVST